VAEGGFEQCYNAQAAVATGSLLVVAADVSQAPNDKQQLTPMLDKIGALPAELDRTEACGKAGIEPLIAPGRQGDHPTLEERFASPPPREDPTPLDAVAHRLKTPEGRKL